ncbi:LapA family protein [Gordonia aichiensis]|uniref:LapA family protein n=2 Tax=Gordonia TaxID=2053 RepID=UPI0032643DCE
MTTQEPSDDQNRSTPEPTATPAGGGTDDLSDRLADERHKIHQAVADVSRTRTRATYVAWVIGVVALIVLLVFIVANLDNVEINLLFGKLDLPIGVAVLVAAIVGALITAALGGARILQLNRVLKKAGKTGK